MPVEGTQVSAGNSGLGSLQGCLVDGDKEQRGRERKIRGRALVISVTLQSAILAAVALIPVFGKPERIALAKVVALPPYRAHREASSPAPAQPPRSRTSVCIFCEARSLPIGVITHAPQPANGADPDAIGIIGPMGPEIPGATNLVRTTLPKPPDTPIEVRHPVKMTHLDPAMLVHRVEPVYPALARQIGRGGRVELRAIIGTDGSIQSLQVVGGDPLFFRSALAAVQQWRYRPTALNGQPVEIDTFVTVIYNLQR
jgi:periplasmic protein TonB